MKPNKFGLLPCAALLAALACDEPLAIDNKNNPDIDRVYATPAGVEAVVSRLYQQVYVGMYNTSTSIWPALAVMAFESASQLGNFGMGTQAAMPRGPIDNQRGNREESEHFRVFDVSSRNARSAANAVAALDRFRENGQSIGTAQRDARAKSFAYFAHGFALGNLALFYDSAGVPQPGMGAQEIPPLEGAAAVMEQALASLDSALAISQTADAAGLTIPSDWVAAVGGSGMSLDQYQRMVRSYRARFRANAARTPEERGAVDWDKVIADATTGITADLLVNQSTVTGWQINWISQAAVQGWHQLPYMVAGMADTSGAYDAWLATPLDDRQQFLIKTPDTRFPSGETRPEQQAKAPGTVREPPAGSGLYIRNRPAGEDTPAQPWGTSQYDYFRFWGYTAKNFIDYPWPIMTRAEIDLLAAEGYLRKGNFAAAATLINRTRVPRGLPSVAGITDLTTAVPGGRACVPRVPAAPSFTSAVCGNILEALKWEKRMETAFTGYGQWFLDSRGWGDLPQATPLDYPVPYQEMDARAQPFYDSRNHAAAKGTYGV
jgi:hypothetical protein